MVEYLKLFVELIDHLAWPAVVVGSIIYLRQDIFKLLNKIRKAKFRDLEIDLVEAIKDVKNNAIELGITVAYPRSIYNHSDLQMIKAAPAWAFLQSWKAIEDILRGGSGGQDKRPVSMIIKDLEQSKTIEPNLAKLILKMFKLRNEIVHVLDVEITEAEAMEWLAVSKSVQDRLKQRLG